MKQIVFFFLILVTLLACGHEIVQQEGIPYDEYQQRFLMDTAKMKIYSFQLDTNEHYRGIDLKDNLCYIAGSKGNVYQLKLNRNNAKTLKPKLLLNADSTHLRDLEVMTDGSMLIMGIESPGRIFHVLKNRSIEVYGNKNPAVFLDGIDSWENGTVLAYGDPVENHPFILRSENLGITWTQLSQENLPPKLEPEAGFAASGTGVVCLPQGLAYMAWGGQKARVFKSTNYGKNWKALETPIAHGTSGRGIYAMAWKNKNTGIVLGGNWEDPEGDSTASYTTDGGETWELSTGSSGYRSGGCYLIGEVFLSVGTKGTDITFDSGKTWNQISSKALNAIVYDSDLNMAIGVGNKGEGLCFVFPQN